LNQEIRLSGEIMKTIKDRLSDVASHLESLTAPEFLPKVQDAVEKKDRTQLVKICKKAKVPEMYLNSVVSVLMSVGPNTKWPTIA
jgi:hypothetical protein